MSDLFDPLRSLTDDPVQAPPAAEVRRRGDRIRRRRTALQSLGAACVVAVLVGGGVLVTGASTDSSRMPAGPASDGPTPTATTDRHGPVSRIPDDFPLAADVGPGGRITGPSHRLSWVGDLQICAASYSPADLEVDHLALAADGADGSFVGRQLLLFPSEQTARTMAGDLVATYQGCPEYKLQRTTVRNQVEDSALGDQGWTVLQTQMRADGTTSSASVVHVVRVGRSVLVAETSVPGNAPAPDPDTAAVALGAVVGGMCLFTPGGC